MLLETDNAEATIVPPLYFFTLPCAARAPSLERRGVVRAFSFLITFLFSCVVWPNTRTNQQTLWVTFLEGPTKHYLGLASGQRRDWRPAAERIAVAGDSRLGGGQEVAREARHHRAHACACHPVGELC